jgi:two-component system, NtrC family, nitrogen regulation sensor histidine kinase NtrY
VTPRERKRQWWPIIGSVVVVLLAAVVITLGGGRSPLQPDQRYEFPIFFALTTLIGAALLVFLLILLRSLVRLWVERRSGQLGSRFKVKMVLGAMGVSLLPVMFLFFFSYALVNRTLNLWFPRPLEIANEQSQALLNDFEASDFDRLNHLAAAASHGSLDKDFLARNQAIDLTWITDKNGRIISSEDVTRASGVVPNALGGGDHVSEMDAPEPIQTIPSGAQVWKAKGQLYLAGSAPFNDGRLYVARLLPSAFSGRYAAIQEQTDTYHQQWQQLREYKRNLLLALALITLLLLFTTTWVALFLSKQVTVPIQALAGATREISRGNFDHRIEVQAQDELGTLVRSFNRMTVQLGEGRQQINDFTRNLEQVIEERERRQK